MARRGAPRRPIEEAREFGRLVELERKQNPSRREKLDTLFHRVRRTDPRRWGSRPKMYRLWAEYKKDRARQPVYRPGRLVRWIEISREASGLEKLPPRKEGEGLLARWAALSAESLKPKSRDD